MAATSKRQEFGVIKGQPMWSTRKELETVLAQAGLGEWSPRLAAAARHAMILEPGPFEEGADAQVGASRLGGRPDLPTDVPWPWRPAIAVAYFKEHGERPWPLSFIAQIDFAEIHAAGGLEGFPSSGRLLFFCDPILVPGANDQTCASVMFFPEETKPPGRRDFPIEFRHPRTILCKPEEFIFRPRRLTPRRWLLPPPFGSREMRLLDGPLPPRPYWAGHYPRSWQQQTYEAYDRFWDDLGLTCPRAIRQVGGMAFPDQYAVEADCVKFCDDDYLNNPPEEEKAFWERREKEGAPIDWPDYEEWSRGYDAFKVRERAMYLERSGSWQLVLQIDTDEEIMVDNGRLYVCIRKRDLTERRFDRCWTLHQCT